MNRKLREAFNAEMTVGKSCFFKGDHAKAFHHFERAHVLGQFYVLPHVRTHIWMFIVGLRTGDLREIGGQLVRIPLGMIGSALGKVPKGNTGGANIKLSKTMPIPEDLRQFLDDDR